MVNLLQKSSMGDSALILPVGKILQKGVYLVVLTDDREQPIQLTLYSAGVHVAFNLSNRGKYQKSEEGTRGIVTYDHLIKEPGYYQVTLSDSFVLKVASNENGEILFESDCDQTIHYIEVTSEKVVSLTKEVFDEFRMKQMTLRSKIKMQRDRTVWTNLHHLAYNVVTDPISPESAEKLQKLLEIIPLRGSSCGKCRLHFKEFLSNYPLKETEIVATRDNFASFLLDYHNSVNKSIKRHEYSPEEAEKHYVDGKEKILEELGKWGPKRNLGDYYLDANEGDKIEDFFKELDVSVRDQIRQSA